VADPGRIEELRRRVDKDPASIAFAQLAEEYRRAGRVREAIETCQTGLVRHPGYLSARVTLGRALLETGELDAAQEELKRVLRTAPENLAALRGLAEIHHRRGELREALAHYRTALEFARHDAELERVIAEITSQLEPSTRAPKVVDGLSFEEAAAELLAFSSGNGGGPANAPDAEGLRIDVSGEITLPALPDVALPDEPDITRLDDPRAALTLAAEPSMTGPAPNPLADPDVEAVPLLEVVPTPEPAVEAPQGAVAADPAEEADRQIAALERWLEAIVTDRERRNTPSA
jgi:tetratricopeptide (TPR) repeat protein